MLRRFGRDSRAVTAIEFALLALPLFMLIMGGIEFGFEMFSQARLRDTLDRASRMATTGNIDDLGTSGDDIDAFVKTSLTVVKGADVQIVKSHYDSFDQVRKPETKTTSSTQAPYCWQDVNGNKVWDADPSQSDLGGANDIINYKVTLTYPALFPLITRTVTGQSNVVLTGQQTLQNEPFGGGADVTVKQCCISAAAGNPVTCT